MEEWFYFRMAIAVSNERRSRFFGSLIITSGMVTMTYILNSLHDFLPSWVSAWLRWCPTSLEALEKAEEKLLSYLKQPFNIKTVNVPCQEKEGKMHDIRTLSMNVENAQNTPLVMLHGLASGIGLWVLNLDSLSRNRPVYTFDILGFGRSSRPSFSKDAVEVENQLTESIEHWRQQMGLEKFILLGHSMGGFLAASYALRHPERVSHLILADPWGFPEVDKSARRIALPFYVKVILAVIQPFNPLAGLRAAGPWGPQLIRKMRPDILAKFTPFVETEDVSDYIYHCNAQTPSGESAFKSMTLRLGWAKDPMLPRIINLPKEVPITFIYGAMSWIDSASGILVKEARKDSYVDVKLIDGAGHHVYADSAEVFNSLVNSVCRATDKMTTSVKDSASSPFRSQKRTKNLQENIASALDPESSDTPSGVINFS